MISDIINVLKDSKVVGITGNSGTGKSTLAQRLKSLDNTFCVYNLDYRFIGNQSLRKELFDSKIVSYMDTYLDLSNQYNWWDWDAVYKDIQDFRNGEPINLGKSYNRRTGKVEQSDITLSGDRLLLEGSILGGTQILETLDMFLFLYTPVEERLNYKISRGTGRETLHETLAKFLLSERSEAQYYTYLFQSGVKGIVYNRAYDFSPTEIDLLIPKTHFLEMPTRIR